MADYKSLEHDSYDENGYQKRCYCEKCVCKYKEWCKKNKEDGCTTCKRRCYTICEIKCEKPVTTLYEWGYKKAYEGKWEPYRSEPTPKPCNSCKKAQKECRCGKKQDYLADRPDYKDEYKGDYEEEYGYDHKKGKKGGRKADY